MSVERKLSYSLVAVATKGRYLSVAYQCVWFEHAALADTLADHELSLGIRFHSLTAKCRTVSVQHYVGDLDIQSWTTRTTERPLLYERSV